jgi:hypothetical protein
LGDNDLCQIFFAIFFALQIIIQIIEELEGGETDQKNEGIAEVFVEGVDYFFQRAHKATHLDEIWSIFDKFMLVESPQTFISPSNHFQNGVNVESVKKLDVIFQDFNRVLFELKYFHNRHPISVDVNGADPKDKL